MADDNRLPKLETLLTAAAKTFAERGYGGTSMRDIAQDSGISLSGIYYYTKGKAALLYDIQARAIDALITSAKAATAGGSSADDQLLRFIESHMAYMRENASFVRVLSHESADGEMDKRALVETKRKEYVQMLRDILSKVMGSSSHSQIPLEFAADMAFAMMSGPNQWGLSQHATEQKALHGSTGQSDVTISGGIGSGTSGGSTTHDTSGSAGSTGSGSASMNASSSHSGSTQHLTSSQAGSNQSTASLTEQSRLIYALLIGGLKGRAN